MLVRRYGRIGQLPPRGRCRRLRTGRRAGRLPDSYGTLHPPCRRPARSMPATWHRPPRQQVSAAASSKNCTLQPLKAMGPRRSPQIEVGAAAPMPWIRTVSIPPAHRPPYRPPYRSPRAEVDAAALDTCRIAPPAVGRGERRHLNDLHAQQHGALDHRRLDELQAWQPAAAAVDAAALLRQMGIGPASEALRGSLRNLHVAWHDPGCPGMYRLGCLWWALERELEKAAAARLRE